MPDYSDKNILNISHDVLEKLSKEKAIDLIKYLKLRNWRTNDLKIRQLIYRKLKEHKLVTSNQNYEQLNILEFGEFVANEIGGLKQFIHNQNNPITDDNKLKIDFVNYLVKNEQENKISKTTNYSKFRNIEKERVELCADFLIEKNIIKSDNNGLTLKPREPAFRIVKKPLDFDLIVQTAKFSQEESSDDLSTNNAPAKKSAKQKLIIENNSNKPSGKVQTQLRNIALIAVIISFFGLILTLIKTCSN